jgi:hypothetical protein
MQPKELEEYELNKQISFKALNSAPLKNEDIARGFLHHPICNP